MSSLDDSFGPKCASERAVSAVSASADGAVPSLPSSGIPALATASMLTEALLQALPSPALPVVAVGTAFEPRSSCFRHGATA